MLCEMLCLNKLLLLLLWFLLLLFVALIQAFQAASTLAVLVESVKMLKPAVSTSARLLRALLRAAAAVCQVMNPVLSDVVSSSLVKGATISSNHTR